MHIRTAILATAASAALLVAGCTPTETTFLAAFGAGLANVSCQSITTSTASGGVVSNIISIAAPTAQAAQDDATAAAAANIAAQLCPAFKGLANVVIQATVASSAPAGTPTVSVAPVASAKRGEALPPAGVVTSINPFVFMIPVKAAS